MTNLRLISTSIGFSALLTSALFALRSLGAAPPDPGVGGSSSQDALESQESGRGDASPTWPPPEGTYWGM